MQCGQPRAYLSVPEGAELSVGEFQLAPGPQLAFSALIQGRADPDSCRQPRTLTGGLRLRATLRRVHALAPSRIESSRLSR